MPYPQSGEDGIGEKDIDASSTTDFVGVGGTTDMGALMFASLSTSNSVRGNGLLHPLIEDGMSKAPSGDIPPIFGIGVDGVDCIIIGTGALGGASAVAGGLRSTGPCAWLQRSPFLQ